VVGSHGQSTQGASRRASGPIRAFKLTEIESWPECVEILIEGEVDREATEVFRDALEGALDCDRLYVIVDLARCELIDVAAAKLLVVAHAHLSARGAQLLIFGAAGQVRRALDAIEAFDSRVLVVEEAGSRSGRERSSDRVPPPPRGGLRRAVLSRLWAKSSTRPAD